MSPPLKPLTCTFTPPHVPEPRSAAELRFEPGFPLYLGLRLDQNRLHLSEHTGDAQPDTLLYLYVPDIDAVAQTLGVTEIDDMPWGRDIEVRDPDGNRLRIGTPHEM